MEWIILVILITPIALIILSKLKMKKTESDKVKNYSNKEENHLVKIISNMNYEIVNVFNKYNIKYYDMALVETTISIMSAFQTILHGNKNDNDIINILFYIDYLNKHSTLTKKEIQEIKLSMLNNKIYVEDELIKKLDTNQLVDTLTKIIIENCTDETWYKYSQLSIELANIITNHIQSI